MMKILLLLLGCHFVNGRMISISEVSPRAMFDASLTDSTLRFARCDGFVFDKFTMGGDGMMDKWSIKDGYFCPGDGDDSGSTTTSSTTTMTVDPPSPPPTCGMGGLLSGPFSGLVANKLINGSFVDPLMAIGLQDGVLDALMSGGSFGDKSFGSICGSDSSDGAMMDGFGFHEFGINDLIAGKSAIKTFLYGVKDCLFGKCDGDDSNSTTTTTPTPPPTTTTTTTCTGDCPTHLCENLLAKKIFIFKGLFCKDDIINDPKLGSVIMSRLFPDDFTINSTSGIKARKFLAAGSSRCASGGDCTSWTDKYDAKGAKLLLKGLTVLKVGSGVTIVLTCALAVKTLEKLFRAAQATYFAVSAIIHVKEKFKQAAIAASTSHMLLIEQLAAKTALISFAKDLKTCFHCTDDSDGGNGRSQSHDIVAVNETMRFAQMLGWYDTTNGLFDGDINVIPDLANPIPNLQALDLVNNGSRRSIKRYILQRM